MCLPLKPVGLQCERIHGKRCFECQRKLMWIDHGHVWIIRHQVDTCKKELPQSHRIPNQPYRKHSSLWQGEYVQIPGQFSTRQKSTDISLPTFFHIPYFYQTIFHQTNFHQGRTFFYQDISLPGHFSIRIFLKMMYHNLKPTYACWGSSLALESHSFAHWGQLACPRKSQLCPLGVARLP